MFFSLRIQLINMNRLKQFGTFASKASTVLVRSSNPVVLRVLPLASTQSIRTLANMVKAQKFIYAKKFVGEPKETDFTLETEELAPIKDGGRWSTIKLCFDNIFCLCDGLKRERERERGLCIISVYLMCLSTNVYLNSTEVLVKAIYLSVDPYMRPYMASYPVGVTMIGGQVAE